MCDYCNTSIDATYISTYIHYFVMKELKELNWMKLDEELSLNSRNKFRDANEDNLQNK